MQQKRIIRFVAIIGIIILLFGCNFRPEVLGELFSSSTPIPSSTSTPLPTPTITATPIPPIDISPCAYARYCPESSSITSFINEEVYAGIEYTVEIPYNIPVTFNSGWITKDEATLDENLKHLRFILEIDDNDYYNERFTTRDYSNLANDPETWYPSISTGITTAGWNIGQWHKVNIGIEFDAEIFDGWDTYPAGTRFEYIFIVKPVREPTITPTLTITPTIPPTIAPTHTFAPRPTAIPPTATPACERSGSISIKNDTGASVTLYMKGPANFTFSVAAGNQTISVCPGSYNYTAYGCGGASRTGTVGDGDEIEFWCE
jgi:hypothetical protein